MQLRRSASSCLALLLSAAGCTGERPAEGAVPPTATAVGAAPTDPPRTDPSAPASRIRTELGDAAVAIVERADAAGAARMKVIAAHQAEREAMTSDALIGGYPIEAPLVALDADARARLLRRILDDASYDHETARRCANDYFVGVRFQRGRERVEFNLGVGCMQAFWSVRDGDDVRREGALLTDEAAEAVLQLLADAGVRGALR
jgi:hypothetical protein